LSQVAYVRRGIATGANQFFLRSDEQVDDLPKEILLPAISRLRDLDGPRLDEVSYEKLGASGAKRWLLQITMADLRSPGVPELLEEGLNAGYHNRFLCANRKHWFVLEHVDPPDILLGPMSKHEFRIVINDVRAVHTNTLYGIRLREPHAADAVEALAGWLMSSTGQSMLRAASRQHGDGLRKLEPGALSRVELPSRLARRLRNAGPGSQSPSGECNP
jgi:hypothetical protein